MNRTVLFMPSWYPTKENPALGVFFKEQLHVLAKSNDMALLLYRRHDVSLVRFFFHLFFKRSFIRLCPEESSFAVEAEIFSPGNKLLLSKFLRRCILGLYDNRIVRLLKKSARIDVVYAVTAQVNSTDAGRISRILGVPYVVSEHSPFPVPGTVISPETRRAISEADAFISISRDKTRQVLMQNISICPYLIGNYIDESKFTIGIKKDLVFNILTVAAYNFYKDYPTFLKAMRRLMAISDTNFRVTIVGYSPIKETNVWNQGGKAFLDLIDSYGIRDICDLVPVVSHEAIARYYQQADVFVMTSVQEGFPVSVLEAAACGIPVFSTKCGGSEDFIDSTCGCLFELQDYEGIALRLKDLMDGKISFNPKTIRGKVVSEYGTDAFLNKMNAVFSNVIEEHQKKAAR